MKTFLTHLLTGASAFAGTRTTAVAVVLAVAVAAAAPGAARAENDTGYNDLAVIVSEPVFDATSVKAARDFYTDGGAMARKEYERQRLDSLRGLGAATQDAREKIGIPLGKCYGTYTEIRRLDNRTPDYEGLAKRAVAAAPGLYKAYKKDELDPSDKRAAGELAVKAIWEIGGALVNSYNLSKEKDKYADNYKSSRLTNEQAMSALAARRSAATEKAKPAANKAVVVAGISPSLANTYIADIIELRNDSGKDLTACSLFVKLAGTNAGTGAAETDRHFHFVSYWPAGASRYLWYPSKSNRGVATDESVDVVTDVAVTAVSDQLETTASFRFAGEKYDDYVKGWANKNLKPEYFSGRWYNDEDNLIDPAGFDVTYKGELSTFNVKQILVRATHGVRSETIRHTKTDWNSGETKWICHKNFNPIYPKKVEVIITFPGTSYEHVVHWNR